MKERLYKLMPNIIQNLFVTGYNIFEYKKRYSNNYKDYLKKFADNKNLSFEELKQIQNKRFLYLLNIAKEKSNFYKKLYGNIRIPSSVEDISWLPILSKEDLRENINDVVTIDERKAVHGKTGGTTGKSLEVLYTYDNIQERFAMLDNFRGQFGYKLGKKTAWFSGKNLLTQRDIKKKRFWKTDYLYNVRYYSTFHIKDDYLKYYVKDIIKYRPEYLVGFPSTILEIARYGLKNGYNFPQGIVKAIFPTAETITSEMREVIEYFFHAKIYNQYASSEGAPFIFECEEGNLHLELQSGVFEVLDDNNQPSLSGRMLVTSFTTEGTPLIRYDIGDRIVLDHPSKKCTCGNHNPLVKEIQGRIDDYIYSPENGKINLGNVSNTLKNTQGIIRFQAIQNDLDRLDILVVADKRKYTDKIEKIFVENWRDRIGSKMKLNITIVDDIPNEKSGKYRIIKNNIKHLINNLQYEK